MRRTPSVALTLALAGLTAACSDDPAIVDDLEPIRERAIVNIDGEQRTFGYYVPVSAQEKTAAPLLIGFHGSGGIGELFQANSDLDDVAEELGMIVAFPDAPLGNWAEDCGCNNADRLGVNDTLFTTVIIETLAQEVSVDLDRVWAAGFSQGGLFATRLGCQFADRVRGILVISSTFAVPLAERCEPSEPVDVLMILSQDDPFFPWEGTDAGALSLLPAEDAAATWAGLNDCGEPDVDTVEGLVLTREWEGCADGSRVWLIGVSGGGHSWKLEPFLERPAGWDTNELVAEFLGG